MNNIDKIACCNICLLAQAMKVCKSCPFNPANLKNVKPNELAEVKRQELLKGAK